MVWRRALWCGEEESALVWWRAPWCGERRSGVDEDALMPLERGGWRAGKGRVAGAPGSEEGASKEGEQ